MEREEIDMEVVEATMNEPLSCKMGFDSAPSA